MFELISQSRYELQQQLLFNPNGLAINTSNRFGNVDAVGNVNPFISVSHPNFGIFVNNQQLTSQPNLIVDHFGTGKNAILFNGTSDFLIKVNTPYQPNWDDEFWVALNFKTTNKANNAIFSNGQGILFSGGTGFRIQFSTSGALVFVLVSQNNNAPWAKNHFTNNNYADNVQRSLIYHHKGTNTITDDDFYINGTIVSSTSTRDDDFTGKSIYPFALSINTILGQRADSNAKYSGYLGKTIFGLGNPNITAINNALNSAY
jgi:hypothetical protein